MGAAELTIDALVEQLPPHYAEGHRAAPKRTAVSQLLAGRYLLTQPTFIGAVIRICAHPGEFDKIMLMARTLMEAAVHRPSPANGPEAEVDGHDSLSPLSMRLDFIAESNRRLEAELSRLADLLAAGPVSPQASGTSTAAGSLKTHDSGIRQRSHRTLKRAEAPAHRSVGDPFGHDDVEIRHVSEELVHKIPDVRQLGELVRRSIDGVIDGLQTGRYSVDQLTRPERAMIGARILIALRRDYFPTPDSDADLEVSAVQTDYKFSFRHGRWLLPPESVGNVCLLASADDDKSVYSLGLLRPSASMLSATRNRDGRHFLSPQGLESAWWFAKEAPLPVNLLHHAPSAITESIMGHRSGQQRVNDLFRLLQGQPIRRTTIATVAMQSDYMKRMRSFGGAPEVLRKEGIAIFGPYSAHRGLAQTLGLPSYGPDEFVSARLAPLAAHHADGAWIALAGSRWVLADESDPIEPIPPLPQLRRFES